MFRFTCTATVFAETDAEDIEDVRREMEALHLATTRLVENCGYKLDPAQGLKVETSRKLVEP